MEQTSVEPETRQSLVDLLGILMRQTTELIRGELALVQSQISDKLRVYSSAASTTGAGLMLALMSAMTFVAAAVIALAPHIGYLLAALSVAIVLGVIAAALVARGVHQFRR